MQSVQTATSRECGRPTTLNAMAVCGCDTFLSNLLELQMNQQFIQDMFHKSNASSVEIYFPVNYSGKREQKLAKCESESRTQGAVPLSKKTARNHIA